jgi:hypothetical protein
VTRPALAADLHAKRSVRIIRSLAPEALEFQQTHEIENTWPDKIMYSLSIPHKVRNTLYCVLNAHPNCA